MTDEMMNLRSLVEKSEGAVFLREVISLEQRSPIASVTRRHLSGWPMCVSQCHGTCRRAGDKVTAVIAIAFA